MDSTPNLPGNETEYDTILAGGVERGMHINAAMLQSRFGSLA